MQRPPLSSPLEPSLAVTPIAISGNVESITGVAAAGVVVEATLVGFADLIPTTTDGVQIVNVQTTSSSDGSGAFTLNLLPNDGITPANVTYYSFQYRSAAGVSLGSTRYRFTGTSPINLASWQPLSELNYLGPPLFANVIRNFPPNGVGQVIVGDLLITGNLSFGSTSGPIGGGQAGYVSTPFSATPTFTPLTPGSQSVFSIILTADVTSSSINMTGITAGCLFTWQIIQDVTGGHSFVWPTNVLGMTLIDNLAAAGSVTSQSAFFNGTNFIAQGAANIIYA